MLPWPNFATFASAVASRAHGAGPGRSTQARRTGSRAGTRGHGREHPNWLPGARRRARQRARCGRVQGAVARVRSRVRRLRRVCGQELRLVQLCSSHERSGQKLLAVQLPRGCLRFCMAVAVPDSALSRDAEQSVEPIHTGDTGRSGLCGLPWPVPSRSSMQLASWRAPGLAQRELGARVPAPAERRIQRPCVLRARPSGISAGGGVEYRGENMALNPAALTPPPSADRAMHSTRAQDAYGTAHR